MMVSDIRDGADIQTSEKEAAVTAIGFVGFGEVAARLSAAVLAHGGRVSAYDVLLDAGAGAETLKRRAGDAPVEFGPLSRVVGDSEIVLSTVTTDVAAGAAAACAPHLKPGQIFVDLNATSPAIKRRIGETIAASGADFVEGAILGAIGVTGARTRILVCGEKAEPAARTLTRLGLNVGFYGREIGRASMFKLLRSVFSKGMEALLIETLLAARRAGVADDVWREIVETLEEKPFSEVGANWMRTHGTAHARRYHEVVQVEELLRELGVEPLITRGTAAFFERSTRLALAKEFETPPSGPEEVFEALDELLRNADLRRETSRCVPTR
jgi:3-hydroxyisobutyrate dehydrogenase-like beta-hydroxyacid dehydrogenase